MINALIYSCIILVLYYSWCSFAAVVLRLRFCRAVFAIWLLYYQGLLYCCYVIVISLVYYCYIIVMLLLCYSDIVGMLLYMLLFCY